MFIAVTDPIGAESAGQPVPHRCFLELDGIHLHGLDPFERKFKREHGAERQMQVLHSFARAVIASPQGGEFLRFTWSQE